MLGPSPCLEEPSRKAQGAEAVPDKPGPTERKGETAFFTYSQSHQASPETNTLLPYVSKYLQFFWYLQLNKILTYRQGATGTLF